MRQRFALVVASTLLLLNLSLAGQDRPSLAGTWVPIDPAKAQAHLAVGLSLYGAKGLTISQEARSLTIRYVDELLGGTKTVVVQIEEEARRGTREKPTATWAGSKLAIDHGTGFGPALYSIEGEHLRIVQPKEGAYQLYRRSQ